MENKKVNYLRLSITDKCNLNCVYCNPRKKTRFLTHEEVLRYEEMCRLVKICVGLGIEKVRITGGEPLIKKDIIELIRMLKQVKGLRELVMTTNGVYLKENALCLKEAGLDRINISINTLRKDRYAEIAGTDYFERVWDGIYKLLEVGLSPVKLNVVVMKGVNDDEILDFAALTLKYPLSVRFVEFFPTTRRSGELIHFILANTQIKARIEDYFGRIKSVCEIKGSGPAQYYRLKGALGPIGFINSYSNDFCDDCSRMRIDCAGRISPCLFSGHVYDLRRLLRSGKSDEELSEVIKDVFSMKLKYNKKTEAARKIEMSSIGG